MPFDLVYLLENDYTSEVGGENAAVPAGSVPTFVTGQDGNGISLDGTDDCIRFYGYPGLESWEVPGGFTNTGLTYDSTNNTFWIGDFTNSQLVETSLAGVATGNTISLGYQPQGVAFDSSDDTLWVADHDNEALRHYELDGTAITGDAITSLGYEPNGLAYNPTADELIYVRAASGTGTPSNVLARHSASTGSLIGTVTASGTSTQCDGLEWDDSASQYLVSDDATDEIFRINTSGTTISSIRVMDSVEDIALVSGAVWFCADAEFHSSLPGGNRVSKVSESGYDRSIGFYLKVGTIDATEAVCVFGDPVTNSSGTGGTGLYVLSGGTTLRLFCCDGTTRVTSDSTGLTLTSFKHIAVVCDNSAQEVRLYVDESLTDTLDVSTVDLTKAFTSLGFRWHIGASLDGDLDRFADIDVDTIFISEHVWTTTEIANAAAGNFLTGTSHASTMSLSGVGF